MSVVAVKRYPELITMASDSIILSAWQRKDQERFRFAKMSKVNNMLIGFTGYAQEGSMFQVFAANHRPEMPSVKCVVEFMIDFQKWLKGLSINMDKDETADSKKKIDNDYLIAFDDHIYHVNGWEVMEVNDFYSIGAGEDYALAALHLGRTPKEAVELACKISCYVAGPILEESLVVKNGEV